MKRIWAPWRFEYVRKPTGKGCFLCRILKESDDKRNLLLRMGERVSVVLNRYPYNNGHMMVFPNRHVSDLKSLGTEAKGEIMAVVEQTIDILQKVLRPEGFNVGVNLGRAAGAGLVGHIHFHVVPRWNGDTNFMPVLSETKVISQSLLELWEQLQPFFATQAARVARPRHHFQTQGRKKR
ncbi:MAG: HIT family protein [Kiritimatiellia bacterium]